MARWEAAQKACARSQLAFDEALHSYLLGLGPPPSRALAGELAAARSASWECLMSIFQSLRQSRATVPLL